MIRYCAIVNIDFGPWELGGIVALFTFFMIKIVSSVYLGDARLMGP